MTALKIVSIVLKPVELVSERFFVNIDINIRFLKPLFCTLGPYIGPFYTSNFCRVECNSNNTEIAYLIMY